MKVCIFRTVDESIAIYLKKYKVNIFWLDADEADEGEAVIMLFNQLNNCSETFLNNFSKIILCVDNLDQNTMQVTAHHKNVEFILMPFSETSFSCSPFFQSIMRRDVYAEELLNEIGMGYWEWRPQIQEIYENEQWFKMLGYDKKNFVKDDEFFYGLMHPLDLEHVKEVLDRVERGEDNDIHLNFRLRNIKGNFLHILAQGKVMSFDDNQLPTLIAGVHVDVSDLKATEARVNLLSKAIEVSPVGLILTNPSGEITYINHTFEKLSGYSYDEVCGKEPSEFLLDKDSTQTYVTLHKRASEGKLWQGLLKTYRKDGSPICINTSVSPIMNDRGQITSYIGVVLDVTLNVEKENEMIERNTRLTKQKWILQELTRTSGSKIDGIKPLYKMTEAVSKALQIKRSSIFFFEEMDRVLVCQDAYNATNACHTIYKSLNYFENVNYFMDCIAGAQVVLQQKKPSLAYEDLLINLRKLNINDSVHMPIWINGKVKGVLRAESEEHQWLSDEISFLRSVSDLITIHLESKGRIEAQNIAENAMNSKTNFLANISHEIKTPMNAIVGMTHLTLQTNLTNQQKQYMSNIEGASQHLLVLMNDLLDYSKVEVGKIQLEHIEFDLPLLLKRLEDMVQFKLKERNLEFKWQLSHKTPTRLIGDPYRLNQILLNLVSNSIKFTEEGVIEVEVERLYDDKTDEKHLLLEFKVRDTGIGIEKEKQERMFESFEQADTSTSRKYGGTGLGLAISKALVELCHGEIYVESQVNKGSTFTFTILFELSEKMIEVSHIDHVDTFKFSYLDIEAGILASSSNRSLYLKKLQQYLIYYHEDLVKFSNHTKEYVLSTIGGEKMLNISKNRTEVFEEFKEEIKTYLSSMLNVSEITDRIKDDGKYLAVLESFVDVLNDGFINEINKQKDRLNCYWPPLLLWKYHENLMKLLDSYLFEDAVLIIRKMLNNKGVSYE